MAYPPSSYGERNREGARPPLQGFRRSFTAPHRQLSVHEQAGLDQQDADAGILFSHPHVRIIAFAPPPESINSKTTKTNDDADYPIDTVETLPWRSRTENLMTSGPLIIEKVRGSVPCFKCGPNFVQPIVRNSQCWCVDGESKFVLRKGRLQYYRFELPTQTEEEKKKVEELMVVLARVLKYERTPCPFKRGFHVELPDDAITPRRKGKWKRREGSLPADTETPPLRRSNVKLGRSFSMQTPSFPPTGGSPAERRGSDYGFVQTPRHTSLRTSYLADRPETPSSMASDEDLDQRANDDVDQDSETGSITEFEHEQPKTAKQGFVSSAASTKPMSEPVPMIEPDLNIEPLPKAEVLAKFEPLPKVEPIPRVEPGHNVKSAAKPEVEIPRMPEGQINDRPDVGQEADRSNRETDKSVVDQSPPLAREAAAPSFSEADNVIDVPVVDEIIPVPTEMGSPVQEDEAGQSLTEDEPVVDYKYPSDAVSLVEDVPIHDSGVPSSAAYLAKDIHEAEESGLPDLPVEISHEQVHENEPDETSTEFDLLDISDIPEGTFLPSTPELHYLEEHADLLEEHGFSDEELEPLATAAAVPFATAGIDINRPRSSDVLDDNESIASTAESFHTIDSGEPESQGGNDVNATTLVDSHDPLGLRSRQHKRDVSEITVTASTFSSPDILNVERFVTAPGDIGPTTPGLIHSSTSDDSWPDPQTPSDIQQGLRRRLQSHSSGSPMRSNRNVFTSGSQNQGNHLTSAILQKACNVALVKPIEVVVLLVHVLARIAGGATVNDLMSGELFKRPHQRRHSTSFPDQVARQSNEEDEDDFGVPLRGRTRSNDEETKPPEVRKRDTDADSLFDLD